MTNKYFELSNQFKDKLINSIHTILSKYNYELELKIEDINLLENKNNCIASSTAIGFCLEEFIVNELSILYQQNKNDYLEIKRVANKATQNSSYDFYSNYNNELFLVNIKVDKSNNNAVAAIQQLYNDYVIDLKDKEKHFLVLKIIYCIQNSKIRINDIKGYFLEEVDFSKGYMSDNRSWSETSKQVSGRLQVSPNFFKNNKTDYDLISSKRTKEQIDKIYNNIIKKIKVFKSRKK